MSPMRLTYIADISRAQAESLDLELSPSLEKFYQNVSDAQALSYLAYDIIVE